MILMHMISYWMTRSSAASPNSAFGSVQKMMSGKRYPQNVHALRIVVEVLLAKHIKDQDTPDQLDTFLQSVSSQSPTSQLWVDNLIKPVNLMMMFTRAERESDWHLHLYTTHKMIDYFHAAGHVNYARYGTYYLHSMKMLDRISSKVSTQLA